MKILTWNVNGIRASNRTTSIKSLLDSLSADIICFQETKITRNLLTSDIGNVDGYLAFFSFSRKKGGYSGVVTYIRKCYCPVAAEEGLTGQYASKENERTTVGWYNTPSELSKECLMELDSEGRCVITEHEDGNGDRICILNVYCPMAIEENEERYLFKLNFYKLLEFRCRALKEAGKHVIVVGDLNVSHRKIDHCDPDPEKFDSSLSRRWFDAVLYPTSNSPNLTVDDKGKYLRSTDRDNVTTETVYSKTNIRGDPNLDENDFLHCSVNEALCDTNRPADKLFVDLFRKFHPCRKDAYTCWNTKTRARETNYGTRIDYILTTFELGANGFTDCSIRPDIQGSDHCPVDATIKTAFVKSPIVPNCCAVFMPECCGKQREIKSYFLKSNSKRERNEEANDVCSKRQKTTMMGSKNLKSYFSMISVKNKIYNGQDSTRDEQNNRKSDADTKNLYENEKIKSKTTEQNKTWKNIFKGPEPSPVCTGHGEQSILRTVKKEGPNFGRQFYVCNKPAGLASNKDARCNFFKWKSK